MSITAQVVDGKLVQNSDKVEQAQSSESTKKKTGGGSLDKDAFLQLLVAEMKYQNPMEASNNSTEYISQLATFSELESMQNLQDTAEDMKMSQFVGKNVVLNVEDQLISGQVDCLQYEDGKTKLVVNGSCYDMEDIYQVIDDDYYNATTKAQTILATMVTLPDVNEAGTKELEAFGEIAELCESLTDYEKTFITKEMQETIEAYLDRYQAYLDSLEVDPMELLLQKMDSYGARMSDLLQQIAGKESTVIIHNGSGASESENTETTEGTTEAEASTEVEAGTEVEDSTGTTE